MYKANYTTMGIARAGVYATVGRGCSVTIYDTRLDAYLGELTEGGVVIDKRPCVSHERFIDMCISGPMLDESLPPRTVRGVNSDRTCDDANEAGGFDYVSLDLYIRQWERLGARVGYRRGGYVEWSDGVKQEIPSYENRFNDMLSQ